MGGGELVYTLGMVEVSNADRVVFPAVNRTKGDVVAYYERIAPRALVHVAGRPISIRRFPKGLSGPGFFQKNVPPHYPASIERFEVRRSAGATKAHKKNAAAKSKSAAKQETHDADVTLYPLIREPEHLAYLANQGAIEIHVAMAHAPDLHRPDRLVIDLDPPAGAFPLVRKAAHLTRAALGEFGLATAPVATGSKGYHVVAAIAPSLEVERLALTMHKFATLIGARHPEELTTSFRIAGRGQRVFVDWLRNLSNATVIAPYSLRASPRATVACPLDWSELDTTDPDAFTIADLDRLVDRPDSLATLDAAPSDPMPFADAVDAAFERSGLVLERFDRFRS